MMVPLLSATVMKSMAILDPYLDQSPATPSLSSSALMAMKVVIRGSWLQFAAPPVLPQMLLVSNDQILILTVIADSGCL